MNLNHVHLRGITAPVAVHREGNPETDQACDDDRRDEDDPKHGLSVRAAEVV